jgi:septal ring factor EnvC (AmiA/AmiB activator)
MKTETQIKIDELIKSLKGQRPNEEQRKQLTALIAQKNREVTEQAKKSRGLGDTIKKVTNALGIKQCGACKKRQAKLNAMFPYK